MRKFTIAKRDIKDEAVYHYCFKHCQVQSN